MATRMTKADTMAARAALVGMIETAMSGARPTRDDPMELRVIVTKVSRDGMHRRMRVFIPQPARTAGRWEVRDVTWQVARALQWTYTDDGVGVSGCGMDMCFHLAYTLGAVLFGEGYSLTNR